MAFRETIEAILKVKDANRFKSGMDKAARSVRKLGRDEEATAAQTELLEQILQRLEKQSKEQIAVTMALAHSIDDLGDEMVQTAAKAQLLNAVTKKSGSNAVFLGKSWAFWKDRLSLTRSELITTALTIGAYFSPAIIAMGSSFAYAAIGGGAVAGAGLSSFLFGLGMLATVVKPVTENIKKITKAQDQYNLAVAQFGANSKQASRASAHLYGVIQTQGGKAASNAAVNLRKLRDEWAKSTAPARGSLFEIISGGAGAIRNLTPTLGAGTNLMAAATGGALKGVFKDLTGPDMKATFRTLATIFSKSIGPGLRGATNLLLTFGHIIRAVAPWVVKWALAWERTTESWRNSTGDQKRLSKFLDQGVKHFLAWWGLLKAIGRLLKIVFGASQAQGLKVVYTLTALVTKTDEWLQQANDSGKIERFWQRYNQSLRDILWAIQNPVAAINRWLPMLMDAIATTLATHAPQAAAVFANAFVNSGGWAQFLTVAYFLKKFGFFKALGRVVGGMFVVPFVSAFSSAFLASMGISFAAEGAIGAAMTKWGGRSGRLFGRFFVLGVVAAIVNFAPDIDNAIRDAIGMERVPGNVKDWAKDKIGGEWGSLKRIFRAPDLNPFNNKPSLPGGAGGGVIPTGVMGLVGEQGPELARSTPWGTRITPLSGNSMHTLPGSVGLPDLSGAMNIVLTSIVQVDKREIGRAVDERVAYVTARRGGAPPRQEG